MISRIEMISSVVSYEGDNIILHDKNVKVTKNNTFNNVFCNRFFLTIASCRFFKNDWIFINHGLFFQGEYFSTTLIVSNFENK